MVKIIPDESQYLQTITCSSINSASTQVKTSKIILRLIYAPLVTLINTSKKLQEGDTVSFRCGVKSWPPVTAITWFLGDKEMEDQTGNIITMDRISRDQHGSKLRCVAKNKVGVGEDDTILDITCKYISTNIL